MRVLCEVHELTWTPGLETKRCGFVVHSEKGWLGASPDAWVTDPSVNAHKGIASSSAISQRQEYILKKPVKIRTFLFYCGRIHVCAT